MPRRGHRMRWGMFWGLAGLWLAGSEPTAVGTEVVHASRWIGADAPIYLEVSQTSPLFDRLFSAPYQMALAELPGLEQARQGEPYREAMAALKDLETKLDTTWQQALRDLTGGGAVFAVEVEKGAPPRAILIVTPTEPAFLERFNQALLDLVREKAKAKGISDPIKSAEYRGFTGYALGKKVAYAIVEGKLVIGNHADTLKKLVDRVLDGEKAGPSLAESAEWNARRARVGAPQAWGTLRLDRLRELDPRRFGFKREAKPPATFLLGSWLVVIRKADWASAAASWTEAGLSGELTLPAPSGGYPAALKGFVPPAGQGASKPLNPPGTIASLSLWRDLSGLWEARSELFPPEVVQGLTKLDGVAGQFFGARDFGTDVLGALGNEWRLVVARQDHASLNPVPDLKLPAFALVVDLKPGKHEFSQRLKVAFQSIVGVLNLGGIQSKTPPMELGTETVDQVTMTTARYMLPQVPADPKEPVHLRHNFSPALAQVGDRLILSSSINLTRDLIAIFKAPAKPEDATILAQADGRALADLVEINKSRLVMQNMLEKGHDKTEAEREISIVTQLLRHLGLARLSVQDGSEVVRFKLGLGLAE